MATSPETDVDLTKQIPSTTSQDVSVQDAKISKLSHENHYESDGNPGGTKKSNEKDATTDDENTKLDIPGQNDVSAEPPSEQATQTVATAGEDYSVLSVTQKKLIIMGGSFASLFSPMATSIYCKRLHSVPHIEETNIDRSIT